MTEIAIEKLKITMNLFKIVSLWATTSIISFQLGTIYREYVRDMTEIKKEIVELKEWKNEFTIYYKIK